MLFAVLARFFNWVLALFLALVFLVHPVNSESVYAIASLQEPLFFIFGITAVWIVTARASLTPLRLGAIGLCLLLSLLTKETGTLFVAVVLVYAFLYRRSQMRQIIVAVAPVVALYFVLKIHAVGIVENPYTGPIDRFGLGQRLLNVPAMVTFYLARFVWPVPLASAYYWAYRSFSVQHVLMPLAVDLLAISLAIWSGRRIYLKSSKNGLKLYCFFAAWAALGILVHIQVVPLDFIVSETWFYFPIVGLLGMIGVLLTAFPLRLPPRLALVIAVTVIALLALRTWTRGFDWYNIGTLAASDIKVSHEDYVGYSDVAYVLDTQGKFAKALPLAQRAVWLYPSDNDYNTLGITYVGLGRYEEAQQAYLKALSFNYYDSVVENLGAVSTVYGDPATNKRLLMTAVRTYPHDARLWVDLAIVDENAGDNIDAQFAIENAKELGVPSRRVFDAIMANQPVLIKLNTRPQPIY